VREGSFLIGIDGGATSTLAIVGDQRGHILGHGMAGPANHHIVGADASGQALKQAILKALQAAKVNLDQVGFLLFGLAGLDHPLDDDRAYRQIIGSIGLDVSFEVVNDVVIAWAGATLGSPGVAVIAGTGCHAFGVNEQGERWKSSGWDYILGDEGSAYWIGLEGIRAAMRSHDGREGATALVDAMLKHYDLHDPVDMVRVAYAKGFGKTEVAAFARSVSQCAHEGDQVAQRILIEAADEIACAVNTVIRKLDMQAHRFTVGLIGGVFRSGEPFFPRFSDLVLKTAPHARIEFARLPPAVGALLYAFYELSMLTPEIRQTIEASASSLLEEIRWKA
jgi:N-acetylglucosamine kinase-like BadF-type ATPase